MTSSVPSLMASRARSVAWGGCSVNSNLNSRMKCRRPSRISPQRLRVRPRFEAGLTMTLVLSRIGGSRGGRRGNGGSGRRPGRGKRLLAEQRNADDAADRADRGKDGRRDEEPEEEPAGREEAAALIEHVLEAGRHLAAELPGLVEDPPGQSHVERPQGDGDKGVGDGGDDPRQRADDGAVARGEKSGRRGGQHLGRDRGSSDDPEAADAVAGPDERQPRQDPGDDPGGQGGPEVFGSLGHGSSSTDGAILFFQGADFKRRSRRRSARARKKSATPVTK